MMISRRLLWILLMGYITSKGVMSSFIDHYMSMSSSSNQTSSEETLRAQMNLSHFATDIESILAEKPRETSHRCACDSTKFVQIHTKFEKINETLTDITAKLESLSELHYYATEVDQCNHMPCKNGGTCIKDGNSYICNCTDGYEGHDCTSTIHCVVPPAPNNGTVSQTSGQLVPYNTSITYRCNDKYLVAFEVHNFLVAACRQNKWTRYTPVCVFDDCNPDTCSGRGTCINQIGRTICECDEGYEGSDCSVQSNPCDLFPCGERGVCIWNGGTSYTCRCLVEFRGNECETYDANLCAHAVGMEDGRVEDGDISASRSSNHPSYRARLHNSYGWEIYSANIYDWLQVDLKKNTTVVAVASQGSASGSHYVRSYKIAYGFAPNALQIIKDSNGEDLIFQGNSNHNTVVRNNFPSPVRARYFRILLQSWNGSYGGLRLEYYSCYP
ncbi:unnamed protein product [Clavelina lepadiformis]|uniref:Uncharacterized protein n=1 Tax=Clavelina lepadiformis TaxID=159417 RepID=A0ABP0GLP6_CLALP